MTRAPSRGLVTMSALALAVLAGVVTLGGSAIAVWSERDWAPVAQVDGRVISRADARGREDALRFVLLQQLDAIAVAHQARLLDELEAAALSLPIEQRLGDLHSLVIEELIHADLARQWLVDEGLPMPEVDLATELERVRRAALDRQVSWVRLSWQPAVSGTDAKPPHHLGPTTADGRLREVARAVRADLSGGVSHEEIARKYESDGWLIEAGRNWIRGEGPAAFLPAEAVAAARGAPMGPADPLIGAGWALVLDVLAVAPPGPDGAAIVLNAGLEGVSHAALTDWARDRAQVRAARVALLERWASQDTELVRAAELVIGPVDIEGPEGPWVQLSHLVVNDLGPADIPPGEGSAAERLAQSLRSLDPESRQSRFSALVAAAGARSGPLGFFVREQLAPDLATAAFAAEVATDDVLGPVVTDNGEELYYIESRYSGPLDERSIGALLEVHRGKRSWVELSAALVPREAARALGGPWRMHQEFEDGSSAYQAFVHGPVGKLSDPVAVNRELLVVIVLERKNDVPDPMAVARLSVDGWDTWLTSRRASVQIKYVDLAGPDDAASPEASLLPLAPQTPRIPVRPEVP
ncbi:MAG TPA: hypothetical protein VM305_04160 [Candidatus Limnocylindrales bacterium]|nr:hypothetical protein [Candidatus Limnocylindrales bacterium]